MHIHTLLSSSPHPYTHTHTHTHSLTHSQLTGTVSHVLGKATFDSSFQEERQQLIDSCQTSGDHFKAGVMGFASGVFGGATSLITQPYKGAQDSGLMVCVCVCAYAYVTFQL